MILNNNIKIMIIYNFIKLQYKKIEEYTCFKNKAPFVEELKQSFYNHSAAILLLKFDW